MRVERLDLWAYGHYAGTTLDLSRPERGLTVIWGPNEAGKSTARRALVAALFGFDRRDPDAHRHGRTGLRLGVRLSAGGGSELSFVRQGMSRVLDEKGVALGEDTVARFCGGMGRDLFTRLFSVDHDELRSGSEALLDADGEIGRLVYGASLGSGSVAGVLLRLEERAAALFQERGRAQQIPKALDAYRATMRQATAARVRSREWDRRRQAVDDAAKRLAAVRGELDQARADAARLQRIRSARPLLARRADATRRLGALGTVPGAQWAQRASEAVAAYRDSRAALDRAVAEHDQLVAEMAGVEVAGAVLERAEDVDTLVEGVARYRKDTGDLPKRRVELDAARRQLAEQLQILGRSDDDGRIVAEADLMVVEELARRREGLDADERRVHDELRQARLQVAAARARLAALPEPPDVAALDRALQVARPALHRAAELHVEQAERAAAAADVAARAGRLGLGALDPAEIAALRTPAPADVDAERARRQAYRQHLEQIAAERVTVADVVRTVEGQIATLGTSLPDPERLEVARRQRDARWQLVRAVLDASATSASTSPRAAGPPGATTSAGETTPAAETAQAAETTQAGETTPRGATTPAAETTGETTPAGETTGAPAPPGTTTPPATQPGATTPPAAQPGATTGNAATPLADAYEAAVADADRAADERYEHADALATLAQLRNRLEQAADQRSQLDEREMALGHLDSTAEARWVQRWAAVGVEAGTPEAMAEWLRDHRQLVTDITAWRQRGTKLDAARTELDALTAELAGVLDEAGHRPCSSTLELLVAQAEQVVEEAHALADQRRQIATELSLAEQAEPQRHAALTEHEATVVHWQAAWGTALSRLALDVSTTPGAATVAVAAYRRLAALRAEVTSLEHRIDGIEADRCAYEAQVATVAGAVLSPGEGDPSVSSGALPARSPDRPAGRSVARDPGAVRAPGTTTSPDAGVLHRPDDPLGTVIVLRRHLAAAREAHQHHLRLTSQLEQKIATLHDAGTRLDDACRTLGSLRSEAAAAVGGAGDPWGDQTDHEPDSGFDLAISRARQAAALREQIDQLESDLLDGGGGRSLDEIVAEAAVDVLGDGPASPSSPAATSDPAATSGPAPPGGEPAPDTGPAHHTSAHTTTGRSPAPWRAASPGARADASTDTDPATTTSLSSDRLDSAIAAAADRVEALQLHLEEATAAHADAVRAFAEVTDATTAVDLEQDAQGELALAAELATEYARTVLAAEVLRRTITDYGERHRGPLLGRAAELFRALTGGAFDDLLPDADGDRQVLLAKRRGGELCTAAALSDGTRDQLYLALRLAGIEHQLAAADDPPPVVLDDILVHFDDTRAAAALRTLAELAGQTQVLLFTHHERIVDLAGEALGAHALAVVRLAPRDHDRPPAAIAPPRRGAAV